MRNYDPENAPNPARWLALDEQERIALTLTYHRSSKVKLPNERAHAIFHAIVETQIAMSHPSVIRALSRLSMEGLSRHECIHAIGSVLAKHLYSTMKSDAKSSHGDSSTLYDAAVDRLSGAIWRSESDHENDG